MRRQLGMDGFIARPSSTVTPSASVKNIPPRAPIVPAARARVRPSLPVREPVPLSAYTPPERPVHVVRKKTSWRKHTLRASGALMVLALLVGGTLSYKAYSKLHKVFHGTATVAALATKTVDPTLLKGEGDGRVNILLLGIGGAGHEAPDLTDTMLLLSVDPVNNTAALLSVPRDMWVKMPVNYFGANQKINAAYSSGKYHYMGKVDSSNSNASAVEAGFSAVDQTIGSVLGINVNYHVLVDFQAFRQAIDTVGGVTIDVKDQLYDPTMAWENGNNSVLAAPGVQVMDGKKALLYARSRETSSDFARSERQRQIILGLKDKVLSAGTLSNPAKIDGLMNAFGDNVYSDLSTQGAQRLYTIMKKVNNSKISSIGLAEAPSKFVTTDHVGSISVVRPVAGFDNYSAIQAYVRSQLVDGYIAKENVPVALYGATTASASAQVVELKTYGYNITAAGATPAGVQGTVLVDLSGGKATYTRNYLEERYGVKAVTKLPAGVTVQPGAAKFVILDNK